LKYTIPAVSDIGVTASSSFTGKACLDINGYLSPYVDIGITAANVVAAFNENPFLKERNVAISSVTNLGSSSDSVITIASKYANIQYEIKSVSIRGNIRADDGLDLLDLKQFGVVNKPSQRGVRGFTSGSSYSVCFYCPKFKELNIDRSGRISCKDI
jgi:hypothetical protein